MSRVDILATSGGIELGAHEVGQPTTGVGAAKLEAAEQSLHGPYNLDRDRTGASRTNGPVPNEPPVWPLEEWNDTAVAYPLDIPLHVHIERAARAFAGHVAVVFEERALTYAELNAASNRLARYLVEQGVGRDVTVCVCAERSPEMVIALLAILKAGGAYVPLDPDHPVERLRGIVGDARPPVLLTQAHLRPRLAGIAVATFCLDEEFARLSRYETTDLPVNTRPSDLAYVIYTSGSTGTPKGAMNSHAGICNRLLWMQDAYDLEAEDRVLQKTPFSFDVSVWEFFWPLLVGARLVLARPGGHRDPSYLAGLIRRQGITVIHFVPSMLQVFLEEPDLEMTCASLRHVMASGEALPEGLARRCLERIPARLHNLYGPTEAAVDVTNRECRRDDPPGPIPIGRPIANMRTYVLDEEQRVVPVGVAGELYLAGVGVGRGYLGRPDLTAERFVPDRFSADPDARMYRTGDLARLRSDGEIEYLGRLDDQVKLRGFRIELGEIEAALERVPGVRQAVVVAREFTPGDMRLVAYLVARDALDDDSVRAQLGKLIPEYMIPSFFVHLSQLPLTTSGKVDRRSLPAPAVAREDDDGSEHVAPRTPLEQALADIWCEVLNRDRIGVDDDFFRLGGHSLLAARAVTRVRARLGRRVSIRSLFESPTIARFAAVLDSLDPTAAGEELPPIERLDRGGGREIPASFAQQRLWLIDQIEGPGLSAYNIATATQLDGPLDHDALRRAVGDIIARHEPLRAALLARHGDLVIEIRDGPPFELKAVDLRDVEPQRRRAEAERIATLEADKPFHLASGPLLRGCLIRLGDQTHVLLLVVHHIAADGWSLGVLWRELAGLYAAHRHRQAPGLADLPVRYGDYALWQRRLLAGDRLERLLAYWRERLRGLVPLELPGDRPRPAALSYRGEWMRFELAPAVVRRVAELAGELGTTSHVVLLAAFQAVLGRMAGTQDVAVGVPVAGRVRPEVDDLIGFFVNTLVVRADLSGEPSFRDHVGRLREVMLGALEHQDLPFERLVEDLQPERHRNRNPLVQVIFQYLESPPPDFRASGLRATSLPDPLPRSRFDIEFHVRPRGDTMVGDLIAFSDLFDRSSVERLAARYQRFLEAAVAEPDQPLADVPLLPDEERRLVLERWNDTAIPYPLEIPVHGHVEDAVRRFPGNTAVVFDDRPLTYAELNAAANRLARFLVERGVGPDVPVCLCLDRSLEMVIAILGVLKAGGAYVPLDTEDPLERLGAIVADARSPLILTQSHLRPRLAGLSCPTFCLDSGRAALDELDPADLPCRTSPAHLAYVIYTSGSTGVPKGAMNTHAGVCNRVLWMQDEYGLTPADRLLQKTPYTFDVSFWEFLWPLMTGATIVLARPGGHREPSYLARLIRRERCTVVHFVPSMLQVFLEEPGLETDCATLAHVMSSGEALPEPLARLCLDRIPARLHNQYGPTETGEATFREIRRSDPAGSITIGRPIANARAYVLDAKHRPVPVGVTGELYLGGVGVGRGYLGRPDLTAERFLRDPFSSDPDARMYRTGDRARLRSDGEIEFLGRMDDQVKIRGFRIELGEIEAALSRVPGVRQAVVVARELSPGDTRLVAYLVAHGTPDDDSVRAQLAGLIPEYMIPSYFVRLGELPLTTSGKVDRRSLPEPVLGREGEAGSAYVAPRTPLEQTLADIWCEVLGRDRTGVHDDFFRLGGHSLLAARVIARVCALVGRSVELRALFQAPTIERFAAAIHAETVGTESGDRDGFGPADLARSSEIPLSFAQQRLWFIDRLEGPGLSAYNIATQTRLEGALDPEALRLAFEDLIDRHETLRTAFWLRDGHPVGEVRPRSAFRLNIIDLQHLEQDVQSREVAGTALREADEPFDLASGRLLRASLLKLAQTSHILLMTVHHMATDGWSMNVLWRDLAELYLARRDRRASMLDVLPCQYADYARWQRGRLEGGLLARLLAYWRDQLRGLEPVELPPDRPRPPVLSYGGDRLERPIPRELSRSITQLAGATGSTAQIILVAAFQLMLGRLTGREQVAVGVPASGRTRVELEELLGLFVNILVVRADLSRRPTFRELVARVREATVSAIEHQDLPFDRLVDELQPERHRNRNPLVQIVFQLLEPSSIDLSRAGIAATAMPDPSRRARFDLEMHVRPRGAEMTVELVYSTDLYERATIERLAERFLLVLGHALAAPDSPIDEIPLLTEKERKLVLDEWNQTDCALPPFATVHGLFHEQAMRAPDAIALIDGAARLTYRELDARADRLARSIRALGAGPEAVVAVDIPRSIDQIVALLAILKSDHAYLPLDPANPPDRTALILRDARAVAIVTRRAALGALPEVKLPIVVVDALDGGADDSQDDVARCEAASAASGESLAYVIFTSGSTGVPKGVMIEHRSIVRLVLGQEYAWFGPDRVFLQLAPTAFDASTFEIWGALLHGARLVIAPEGPLDLGSLRDLIEAHGVTTLWLTAGLFAQVVDSSPETLASVQEILTGGEAVSPEHVRMAYQWLGPDARIVNGYGPTECTTFACCHAIPREDPAPGGTVPIGRPIANTTAYVLDNRGQPAPIGVAGELYLGGLGVARGYAGRADLTAERMLVSPFRAGECLYRTGDRARWRNDGTLEFLGRGDGQIKLRGFRIEPGEIEAALCRHAAVARAAVAVREGAGGDRRLVACWCPRTGIGDTVPDLASHLRAILPGYMIPSAFVRMEALPLTVNGKLDLGALPAFDQAAPPDASRLAPRDELEARLARIWSDILKVPDPGIRDHFFESGGHSLLAIRMLALIESKLGHRVSIAHLFQRPTIEGLLDSIRSPSNRPARAVATRLRAGVSGPVVVFLPSLFGRCPEGERLGQALPAGVSAYTISVVGEEPYWEGCQTLSDIARGFIDVLLEAEPRGPFVLVGYSFGGRLAFEMARIMLDAGLPAKHVVIIDTDMQIGRIQWRDIRPRDMASMIANLPGKLHEKLSFFSQRLKLRIGSASRTAARGSSAGRQGFGRVILDACRSNLPGLEPPEVFRRRMDASIRAFNEYQPAVYRGDVLLLVSKVRSLIHRAGVDRGWRPWVKGRLVVRDLPGHHLDLFRLDRIGGLIAEINDLIERLKDQ